MASIRIPPSLYAGLVFLFMCATKGLVIIFKVLKKKLAQTTYQGDGEAGKNKPK